MTQGGTLIHLPPAAAAAISRACLLRPAVATARQENSDRQVLTLVYTSSCMLRIRIVKHTSMISNFQCTCGTNVRVTVPSYINIHICMRVIKPRDRRMLVKCVGLDTTQLSFAEKTIIKTHLQMVLQNI